jgi:GNAT superfamily N-acetyltransferase
MEARQLEERDLDDLLELYSHVHVSDDPLPERPVVESLWREIQNSPYFKYFGVFVDKKLVASCTLSIIPNFTRGCRPYGVIENVVTHAKYRKKGYGKAGLEYAQNYAWSKNCYKIMLSTGRKDEGTYRFYESAGFDRHAKQAFLAKPK